MVFCNPGYFSIAASAMVSAAVMTLQPASAQTFGTIDFPAGAHIGHCNMAASDAVTDGVPIDPTQRCAPDAESFNPPDDPRDFQRDGADAPDILPQTQRNS